MPFLFVPVSGFLPFWNQHAVGAQSSPCPLRVTEETDMANPNTNKDSSMLHGSPVSRIMKTPLNDEDVVDPLSEAEVVGAQLQRRIG